MNTAARYLIALRGALVLLAGLAAAVAGAGEALQITGVVVSPQVVQAQRDSASIGFRINSPATVTVKIYDARDLLVWSQVADKLPAGDHRIDWKAVDTNGQPVIPEAYYLVVEAVAADGAKVVYDLTDVTGGETIRFDPIKYDAKTKEVSFTAPHHGRYYVRAGISQAFAVNTLLNNEVVTAGPNVFPWDGFDASRVLDVGEHPQLQLGGFGYRLSDNAIVVSNPNGLAAKGMREPRKWLALPAGTERRTRVKTPREGVDANFYRSVENSRDIPLRLALPKELRKNADGVPILEQRTPIRIELADDDATVLEAQRGEVVFFWGNQLIYDNEASYYPYTFNWQPPVFDGNVHLLTGFVAGFSGNIALATIKVQLGNAP